jgi:hypothetical protein
MGLTIVVRISRVSSVTTVTSRFVLIPFCMTHRPYHYFLPVCTLYDSLTLFDILNQHVCALRIRTVSSVLRAPIHKMCWISSMSFFSSVATGAGPDSQFSNSAHSVQIASVSFPLTIDLGRGETTSGNLVCLSSVSSNPELVGANHSQTTHPALHMSCLSSRVV